MTKGFNLIFVDSFFSARILHCTIVALSAYLFHSPFVFLSYLSVFHTSLGPVNFTKIPHLGIPPPCMHNKRNRITTITQWPQFASVISWLVPKRRLPGAVFT